jgi:spore germination protein KB
MMSDGVISVKQGVSMIAMYILGTTFLVAPGIEAGQDIWIAYLASMVLSIAVACMYARILGHMPGKDFFGILEGMLGRPLSLIFYILIAIYLFQHASYVLRHFAEYINVAALPGTPLPVSLLSMGLLCALAVFYGIEVLGKWSEWFLIIIATFIIVAMLLLTQDMDLNNLRPVLERGFAPVAKGIWALLSFPFTQTVAFLYILPPARNRREPYRIFLLGLLLGGALLFVPFLSNVLVLGVKSVARLYYPSFSTLAIIRIGNFIQRLEIVATTVFMIAVFLKATVLLMGLFRALSGILKLKDANFILIPVTLLVANYAFNAYRSNMEHQIGIGTYVPYFAAFHQAIVPIVLLLLLEWKAARHRRKEKRVSGAGKEGA